MELHISVRDNGDGSQQIALFNTKTEAMDNLGWKEELENPSPYDDGLLFSKLIELKLNGDEVFLAEPLIFDTDG